MAAAFPTSPSNGDLATVNSILYQYASATQSWTRVLTPVYQVANNLSALTFATANGNANLSIAGTPIATWSTSGEYVTGLVSVTGNVVAGNIVAGGARSTTQSSTPPSNPTVGDIWYNSATDVMYRYTYDGTSSYWIDEFSSTVGNGGATGGYYIANGASSITTNYNGNANVTINGTSNVAVFTTTGITAANVSATGNVSADNVVFTTQVSGTGTITTSGNIIGGNITITNVFNPASVSTSGNVTGGNVIASTGNLTGNLFSGVTNNGLIINYNTTSGAANIGPNSTGGSTSLYFGTSNAGTFTNKVQIDNLGNVWPTANATQDLGSNTLRWRSIYTSDLDLNNGIGDWTIVEGEDDLFLYNNRKGKTYKFALIEVDPSTAPPKINDLRK